MTAWVTHPDGRQEEVTLFVADGGYLRQGWVERLPSGSWCWVDIEVIYSGEHR